MTLARSAILIWREMNNLFVLTGDVTDEDIDMVVQSLLSSGSLMTWKFVARKLGLREGNVPS